MPAQKLVDKHSLRILSMEPRNIPPNTSQNQLMDGQSLASADLGEPLETRISSVSTRRRQILTVAVLCFVNLINYMDRFTIAGILEEVRKYYGVQDSSLGLLQTAFVLSYMLFAPLFGYLGDRFSRKWIMAIGVSLWSITTLVGSFMENFYWFLFFRTLVGIGEASYSTIAPTIISDLFVRNVRSRMLAVFYFAIPVGSGMGYIIGSETFKATGVWQDALRVTPGLGFLAVILIMLFCGDPIRGHSEGRINLPHSSWKEDVVALVKNRSFMLTTFGFTCVAFVTGALAWWGPLFLSYGLKIQNFKPGVETKDNVAYKFGIITMLAGVIGVPLGSFLAQRFRARWPNADPLICAYGLLTSAPFIFFAMVSANHNIFVCYVLIFFGEVFLNLNWSLVADMVLVSCFEYICNGISILLCCSVPFVFGIITMISGVMGVPLGSFMAQGLRDRFPRADPLVCGCGLLFSVPFLVSAMFLARNNIILCYILIFFAELSMNLNWAIVADIILYVVVPTRRATAEAFNILFSHALGDAGSPYLIGVVSQALKTALSPTVATYVLVSPSNSKFQTLEELEVEFHSLQYALLITCFVEVFGGLFFLLTALYIVEDKIKATGDDNEEPRNIYADQTYLTHEQTQTLVT